MQMGVQFDRAQPVNDAHKTSDGLLLGREAAHSRWRVLHAGGDATGAEIERALLNALKERSSVALYEEIFISNLLVEDGTCVGVEAVDRNGQTFTVASRATVLASGGAGGLWLHTSNPSGGRIRWTCGPRFSSLEGEMSMSNVTKRLIRNTANSPRPCGQWFANGWCAQSKAG